MANFYNVRREAVFHAEVILAQHGVGARDRLNVFDAIEDAGVWLSFEPLERLYGWYQRIDSAAGIVINASHPPPLQRFTAAHELGHHVLGHDFSVDDEKFVIDGGNATDLKEVAAQTFAANLLMPLAAVEYQLLSLGLDSQRPELNPLHVYRMSVELGVSYLATVTQLATLGKIDWTTATQLRKVRPLALKEAIAGRAPESARSAVWLLDESDHLRSLAVDLGDELHVLAPEIRSSGLRWTPTSGIDAGFAVLADSLEPARSMQADTAVRYGAPQARHFVFRAVGSGTHQLRLDMRPAWLPEQEPERQIVLRVDVEGPRTGDLGIGISVNQHPQLLAA